MASLHDINHIVANRSSELIRLEGHFVDMIDDGSEHK